MVSVPIHFMFGSVSMQFERLQSLKSKRDELEFDDCIGLSRYIAITVFSNIAAIAAFCRISLSILNRFTPNLQA